MAGLDGKVVGYLSVINIKPSISYRVVAGCVVKGDSGDIFLMKGSQRKYLNQNL